MQLLKPMGSQRPIRSSFNAATEVEGGTVVSTVPASRYWIGLQCVGQNCTWLDGTPYDFNNFYNGAPDGATGGAACSGACYVTFLNVGKWDDHGDFAPFNAKEQKKKK
uniref:C-type lectin domain-containing protein n=1 Tax=Acrobeloides nanus TaxID=290746 RepID=A0A914EKN2_9BILA